MRLMVLVALVVVLGLSIWMAHRLAWTIRSDQFEAWRNEEDVSGQDGQVLEEATDKTSPLQRAISAKHPARTFAISVTVANRSGLTTVSVTNALRLLPGDPLVPFFQQGDAAESSSEDLMAVFAALSVGLSEWPVHNFELPILTQARDPTEIVVRTSALVTCVDPARPPDIQLSSIYMDCLESQSHLRINLPRQLADSSAALVLDTSLSGWSIYGVSGLIPTEQGARALSARLSNSSGEPIVVSISEDYREPPTLIQEADSPDLENYEFQTLPTMIVVVFGAVVFLSILARSVLPRTRLTRKLRGGVGLGVALVVLIEYLSFVVYSGSPESLAGSAHVAALVDVGNLVLWGGVIPLGVVMALIVHSNSKPLESWILRLSVGAVTLEFATVLVLATTFSRSGFRAALVLIVAACTVLAAVGLAWICWGKRWVLVGACGGAILFSGTSASLLLRQPNNSSYYWLLVPLVWLGLTWLPAVVLVVRMVLPNLGLAGVALLALVVGWLFLPVLGFLVPEAGAGLSGWDFVLPIDIDSLYFIKVGFFELDFVATLAVLAAVLWLTRSSTTVDVAIDKRSAVVVVALVAVFVNPILPWYLTSTTDVLAIAAALLMFSLLLIRRDRGGRGDLPNSSSVDHVRNMRRLVLAQLRLRVSENFARNLRAELASGNLSPTEFDRRWETIAAIETDESRVADGGSISERAWRTTGGNSPVENGLVAGSFCLLIASPILAYEVFGSRNLFGELTTSQLLSLIRHLARWGAYGFFYGYFYPHVPGRRPVQKALAVFPVILAPELLLTLYPRLSLGANPGLVALVTAGQVLVFCVALGLFWERHLVVAAGLTWGAVRSFRTLASLVSPAATLIVAIAVAVVGVLVPAALDTYTKVGRPGK